MTYAGPSAPSDLLKPGLREQRGAATLIVVMVLFFIVSMVAAYTSRNLIFEQRTSANQLRSTQAAEAAEAGLQWALGLLNSGRIDDSCLPTGDLTKTTFRQRYLNLDGANGNVTPILKAASGPWTLEPSCVFNGATWNCSCPTLGDTVAPTLPLTTAVSPAFRVRFQQHPNMGARGRLVGIEVNGCTSYVESCLTFIDGTGADNEGRAKATAYLTLKGAFTQAPAAALTARTTIDVNAGGPPTLSLFNASSTPTQIITKLGGVTAQAGGAVTLSGLVAQTLPGGSQAALVVDNDTSLQFADFAVADRPDAMFVATFGMRRSTYRDQPGAVILACGGTCTAAQVRTAAAENPGRVIWLDGNLSVDTSGDVGSATNPLAIVTAGTVQFSAAATIYGLVYSQAADWVMAGGGSITGAAVAEGGISGTSTASIAYDATVLTQLRNTAGSFVIVPGTWRDF